MKFTKITTQQSWESSVIQPLMPAGVVHYGASQKYIAKQSCLNL